MPKRKLQKTTVTTIVGNDRNVYYHQHYDIRVNVNNDQCLELVMDEHYTEYVRYPLCNVERFDTVGS